jgi:hypothetical protein
LSHRSKCPLDRLAVLRRAFDATTKDAQFLAEAEKLNLPLVDPVSGPDADKIIGSLYAAPPALVARTQGDGGAVASRRRTGGYAVRRW